MIEGMPSALALMREPLVLVAGRYFVMIAFMILVFCFVVFLGYGNRSPMLPKMCSLGSNGEGFN
jgi:hypothetical protein